MKYKLILKYILLFIVFILLSGGYTLSYYTDHNNVVNEFRAGNVHIELSETEYDRPSNRDKRNDIPPGHEFIKDPSVKNTGKSDCFVFVEISIPKSDRLFIDEKGQKLPEMKREMFSYSVNPEWILINETINNTCAERVYAYAIDNKLIPLRPGEKTDVIKNGTIKTADFIETGKTADYIIPVRAYAVSTTDIINSGNPNNQGCIDPLQVYRVIRNQKSCEIKSH